MNTVALLQDASFLKQSNREHITTSKASTFANLLLENVGTSDASDIEQAAEDCKQSELKDSTILNHIHFDTEAFVEFLNSEEGNIWLEKLNNFLESYFSDEQSILEGSDEDSLDNIHDNDIHTINQDVLAILLQKDDIEEKDIEELETIIMNLLFNTSEKSVEQDGDLNQVETEPLSELKPLIEALIDMGILEQELTEENNQSLLHMNQNWNQLLIMNTLIQNNQSLQNLNQDDQQAIQRLNSMISQFKEIFAELDQSMTKKDIQKQSGKLLHLLDSWKQLTQESSPNLQKVAKDMEETLPKSWRTVFESFEKRQQIVSKKVYNATASVTSSDVSKWVKNALSKEQTVQQVSHTSMQHMPMSKVEQYMIHLQSSEQTEEVPSKDLLRQFSKIMESSRFLNLNQANRQMTIHLRPHHLGDIVVKMNELNGEMLVKLMVQSSDAKRMLESNLHQLKHMFSPHQVVIEKQDTLLFTDQTTLNGEQEEQNQEFQDEADQHTDQQNNTSDDKSFEDIFDEALMNEKV